MKICYVITSGKIGGAQRYLSQIANDQAQRGVDVCVACGHNGDWLQTQLDVPVVRLKLKRSWNPVHFLSYLLSLRTWLKKERPDIVHFHSSHTFFGIPFAKMYGAKAVVTIHGLSYFSNKGIVGFLYRGFLGWALRGADHIVCVCEADAQLIRQTYGILEEHISIAYPGVSSVAFLSKQEARQRLGVPQDAIVIGTLGRFDFQKHQDFLLEVFSRFPDPRYVLCMIGHGPFEDRLRQQAKNLGIEDRTIFSTGSAEMLKAFDVFVLTSWFEGFPYVLLEAGLGKVPVVSSNVGGVSELIHQGVSGLLVGHDVESCIHALSTALVHRDRLAECLYQTVVNDFGVQRLVDSQHKVYEMLLKRK